MEFDARSWLLPSTRGLWIAALIALAGCGGESMPPPSDAGPADAAPGCIDPDGDGYGEGVACMGMDCDESAADVNAGAAELCGDSIDNNCDGTVDEGFDDLDAACTEGTGLCEASGTWQCSVDGQRLECSATAGTPEEERCNMVDDDCNGMIDDGIDCSCSDGATEDCYTGPAGTETRGLCRVGTHTCLATGTWGPCEGDQTPVMEVCDFADNDCNGAEDDVDVDGDTYWSCPGVTQRDCDDANANVYPGALEECDMIDNNCNGIVDEEVTTLYFRDVDGDMYGGGADSVRGCVKPDGYAEVSGDCDDNNSAINPGATEVCNRADDDCNSLIDDGLPLLEIYPDNDGDSFAPAGLTPREQCDIPIGFTVAQDVTGDGTPDWDCNDTEATVFPNADPLCDALDNDCDGITDRWCSASCGGSWPVSFEGASAPNAVVADMDGNGSREIGAGNTLSAKLLDNAGGELWAAVGSVNFLRRPGLFADVDASERASERRLDWVNGAGSVLRAIRLTPGGAVELNSGVAVYDAGSYVSRDIDGDDRAEIFAMDWSGNVQVIEYDPGTSSLVSRAMLPALGGHRIYTNGFSLGDPDHDGQVDLIIGTGYAQSSTPTVWDGRLYAYRFDPTTNNFTDICPGCYDTSVASIFAGSVPELLFEDRDGDGVSELLADVTYFTTNTPGVSNPSAGVRTFAFDSATGAILSGPTTASFGLRYDLDADGVADDVSRSAWYADVDGDQTQDWVSIDATGHPVINRRLATGTQVMPAGSAIRSGGRVVYLGDLDGNGRLDVLLSAAGILDCVEFGPQTWYEGSTWGPPLRQSSIGPSHQIDRAEPNEDRANAYYLGTNQRVRALASSAADADWFLARAYCFRADIQAPRSFGLTVRTHVDIGNDGSVDLASTTTIAAGATARVTCRSLPTGTAPIYNRSQWIEIVADGGASSTDPYYIDYRAAF